MKKSRILLMTTALLASQVMWAQQPLYLDDSQPIEIRVEDALQRMTLDEKIAVIHAQSKFSSPASSGWAFPISGPTTVLMACVPTCCGTSGSRPDRPMTRAWPFLRSPVWQPPGTRRCRASMEKVWARKPSTVVRT